MVRNAVKGKKNFQVVDAPIDRFLAKVRKDKSGCWLWLGSRCCGYGQFWSDGKLHRAHRWILMQRELPTNKSAFACHSCDNPSCVNPDHLFWASNSENMIDAVSKGRLWVQKNRKSEKLRRHLIKIRKLQVGLAHRQTKLTPADVRSILLKLRKGEGVMAIAAQFGVTDAAIWSVRHGKTSIARACLKELGE